MIKLLLLVLAAIPALAGDWYALGARVGVPLGDAFQDVSLERTTITPSTENYILGPTAELLLPFGLGVEVDALYKRTGVEVASADGARVAKAGSWEFPLMAKYRLPGILMRPFFGGGVSFRRFGELKSFVQGPDRSVSGVVMGGGLQLKFKNLRLSPELRYTRWGSGDPPGGPDVLQYSRNQADFLVGITF